MTNLTVHSRISGAAALAVAVGNLDAAFDQWISRGAQPAQIDDLDPAPFSWDDSTLAGDDSFKDESEIDTTLEEEFDKALLSWLEA